MLSVITWGVSREISFCFSPVLQPRALSPPASPQSKRLAEYSYGQFLRIQVLDFLPGTGALNSCMHAFPEKKCWIYYGFTLSAVCQLTGGRPHIITCSHPWEGMRRGEEQGAKEGMEHLWCVAPTPPCRQSPLTNCGRRPYHESLHAALDADVSVELARVWVSACLLVMQCCLNTETGCTDPLHTKGSC